MYFFIAIIFIAEIIIAVSLINAIRKADKAVCLINKNIPDKKAKLLLKIRHFKKGVHDIEQTVNNVINYFQKKKQEYTIRLIKNILIYVLILIIETKFSKIYKFRKWAGFGKSFLRRLLA